jgi:hypothetical protein
LVLHRLAEGNDGVVHYKINGRAYNKADYLGDMIYPDWYTLKMRKKKRFGKQQETCRKDM